MRLYMRDVLCAPKSAAEALKPYRDGDEEGQTAYKKIKSQAKTAMATALRLYDEGCADFKSLKAEADSADARAAVTKWLRKTVQGEVEDVAEDVGGAAAGNKKK